MPPADARRSCWSARSSATYATPTFPPDTSTSNASPS